MNADKNGASERQTLEKEHLELLLSVSALLSSSLDIQGVLDCLMDQVIEVIKAKRGFILMREEEGEEWKFRSTRAINQKDLDRQDFRVSKSVIERVALDGKTILTSDATHDKRFQNRYSVAFHELKSILCVPLIIQGRIMGVIYADNPMETYVFSPNEKILLESIAKQASIALENARLYEKLKRIHEESMDKARNDMKEAQSQLFQSSKMAAIGQLAAGIAHEMNTPLGTILTNAEFGFSFADDDDMKECLASIKKAVQRCRDIAVKLLRLSHPSCEVPQKVGLYELIADTLVLIGFQLTKENITIHKFLENDLFIEGDSGELSQVIMNILLNAGDALKITPPGQERIITIRSFSRNNKAIIEISDNGPGMESAVLDRIFEPFFTTKKIGDGVGLGLSIGFQIVKKNNGRIRVSSQPGKGTTFIVEFKAVQIM
jgi:C4-dicarboxylate-specific signal transduction histidine kinase